MSVSNKTLSILLLAAIVVSLGGTFISLNRLGGMSTTGFASEKTGSVSLDVPDEISIELEREDVDFGECTLGTGSAGITINTERGLDTDNCTNHATIDSILVKNVGNVEADVDVMVSDFGTNETGTFLNVGTSNSSLRYKTTDVDGCSGGLVSSYTAFDSTNYVNACSNLAVPTGGSDNSFETDFEIVVPDAATGAGHSVTVTFRATAAT